ncbi:MAG: hypothetical protein ACKVH8_03935 [Pirellulales bacterium]|jgi:hypothetical protein
MKRIILKSLLGCAVVAVGLLAVNQAEAQQPGYPAMMQNYYVQDYQQGINPEMYIAPVATPPHVGHTYITYPPLSPHEFLYRHQRTYYNYYDGGRGLNRTKIKWYGRGNLLNSRNPLF